MKQWEELIRENVFGLGGHRDHLPACLAHMLYYVVAEEQYNLAYFFIKKSQCARATPTANLPYGMFLTLLYRHVIEAYPSLDRASNNIVDRVCSIFALKTTSMTSNPSLISDTSTILQDPVRNGAFTIIYRLVAIASSHAVAGMRSEDSAMAWKRRDGHGGAGRHGAGDGERGRDGDVSTVEEGGVVVVEAGDRPEVAENSLEQRRKERSREKEVLCY
ncbi:hypothetical protein Tco_0154413 [Tanacetum coccineum]